MKGGGRNATKMEEGTPSRGGDTTLWSLKKGGGGSRGGKNQLRESGVRWLYTAGGRGEKQ